MRQQLGTAPANAADAATKAYVDSKIAGGVQTINASTANTWVRIARITMAAVFDGASASITLLAVPDGNDTVNYADIKIRAGQRVAFGTNPAADIVLMRGSTLTNADLGYVVVQNTPTSIVDFYIRIQASGRQYTLDTAIAQNQTGVITFINQEAGSTTAPTGLVTGSNSTDAEYFGQANLGGNRVTNVGTPTASTDAATKSYVDAAPLCGATGTPVGWRFGPQYVLGTGTGTPTTGLVYFTPIWVAEVPQTIDSIHVKVTTAMAGGTATAAYVALYPDDKTAGLPDTTVATRLGSGTVDMTSAAEKIVTFAAPVVLNPGVYWLAFLYYQGTTAPTTTPVFTVINNNVIPFASATSIGIGTNIRSITSTGSVTALPTTKLTSFAANAGSVVPYMMLRRSA
jgi:hypothetical protein